MDWPKPKRLLRRTLVGTVSAGGGLRPRVCASAATPGRYGLPHEKRPVSLWTSCWPDRRALLRSSMPRQSSSRGFCRCRDRGCARLLARGAFEVLGVVDVSVDDGELVEVVSVVVFPRGTVNDVGRDGLEAPHRDARVGSRARADLVVEPCDAVLELGVADGGVCVGRWDRDGRVPSRSTPPPSGSVEVVLLGLILPGEVAGLHRDWADLGPSDAARRPARGELVEHADWNGVGLVERELSAAGSTGHGARKVDGVEFDFGPCRSSTRSVRSMTVDVVAVPASGTARA